MGENFCFWCVSDLSSGENFCFNMILELDGFDLIFCFVLFCWSIGDNFCFGVSDFDLSSGENFVSI